MKQTIYDARPRSARYAQDSESLRANLVKKINTARQQLGWDDETWATVKFTHGNCQSIARSAIPPASVDQLQAIMNHARACGFKDRYQQANGKLSQPLSQDKQAKLLRALWLELHTLGAVQDPDETALCRWVMSTRKGAVQTGNVTTNLAFLEWRGDDLHQAHRAAQAMAHSLAEIRHAGVS